MKREREMYIFAGENFVRSHISIYLDALPKIHFMHLLYLPYFFSGITGKTT